LFRTIQSQIRPEDVFISISTKAGWRLYRLGVKSVSAG
jgi:hypothetical protein